MDKTIGRLTAFLLPILLLALLAGCQSTAVRSAKIYMQQDDPENAKEVLLEGLETTPNDPELYYILGKVHAELEEWEEMNEAFAKAEELTDEFDDDIENTRYENWRMKFNAAVKPFNEKEFEKAIEMFQTALLIKPGDAETHRRLGLSYLQTEDYDKAEEHLRAAIEAEGDDTDLATRYNLLILQWQQEEYEKVIEIADEILELGRESLAEEDPARLSDVIQKKALALQQLDRPEEAIATWQIAIESDPNNPDFYFNKAILLHSMERYEDAADAYAASLEYNPEDTEARLNAARAYLGAEQYEQIVDVLEPWLFPNGNIEEDNVVVQDTAPYMLLRAAYMNLQEEQKADTLARILVNLQKQEG